MVWTSARLVTVGLIWVQMGKWWDRVRVGSMKVNLRLGGAQSTLTICASEALVANRGAVRQPLRASEIILSRSVAFAVEFWPLDLAWGRQCQQDIAKTVSSVLLTVIVGSRPMLSSELPDKERRDSQQCDTARDRQPNDRPRAESRTSIGSLIIRGWSGGWRTTGTTRGQNSHNNDCW